MEKLFFRSMVVSLVELYYNDKNIKKDLGMLKALIVDGNSILNRSFYGIKLLSNKKGQHTNAIYGFLTSFNKIYDQYKPDAVAIAFDMPGSTFRKSMFSDYKAKRRGMPDELASQLPILKELILALGYKIVECQGYEADDILGTLSHNFQNQGHESLIYTGDRDSFQLISDKIFVYLASNKKADSIVYDSEKINEIYGVSPKDLIEIKALQGDTSDNIPGVKGIGEKTAQTLIQKFKNLEEIYANIEKLDLKENLKKKLIDGKESAYMSRKLGTIYLEAPVELDISVYRPSSIDFKKTKEIMTDLEFFSLMEKMICGESLKNSESDFSISAANLTNVKDFSDLMEKIKENGKVNFFAKFSDKEIKFSVFSGEFGVFCVRNTNESSFLFIKRVLENEKIEKCVYNFKEICSNLQKCGLKIENVTFDILLASYILNPSLENYDFNFIASGYKFSFPEISNKEDYDDYEINLIKCAYVSDKLASKISYEIEKNKQKDLLLNVEIPLSRVLSDMEKSGFKIDRYGLLEYKQVLSNKISVLQDQIYRAIGFKFNISSPKQLASALFERLHLPKGKKSKTGYSTGAKVLEKLKYYHPSIDMILEYRTLSKLKSTYCDGLDKLIDENSRIHAYFNQTETKTGRISCIEPNLQNIPVRTEVGREFRKYFCAKENFVLVDADYSQIELRILAHLSKDESMIEAFRNEEDIHALTASKIFDLPVDMINSEARNRAKTVNFGVIYGMGAFSLSQDLGISRKEADEYIDSYFSKYIGVKNYMVKSLESAREKGYVETILHRRRYLPELVSQNFNLRSFGERAARNTPVQGSAADIIKMAMIKVHKRVKEENLKANMILQIHDELILETHRDDEESVKLVLKEEMENVIKLLVPLKVNISSGRTWYDAKG